MARRVVVVAVAVLAVICALPAVARADPPVCEDGTLVTLPNTPLNLPAPNCSTDNGPNTIVLPLAQSPTLGEIIAGNPNVYRPFPGKHGLDQFKYQVKNTLNEPSNVATVTVLIDTPPTCRSGAATVVANTQLVIQDLDCSDADTDFLDVWVDDPAHGTVSFPNGTVVYTPAPNYTGPDSFSYFSSDPFDLESDDATMAINVIAPPPPVATVQPTPPPAPKDLTAPTLALKNASKKQALAVSLTTNENASATLTAALDKATAKKLKLAQKVGTLKAALKAGTSTLKIRLSSKAAKRFKKLKSVRVTVTAVVADAAGNKTTKTLKVTLKK